MAEQKITESLSKIPIDFVYGLPPSTEMSHPIILNTMPRAIITPCVPSFEKGLSLFRLKDAKDEYYKLLREHGFIKTRPLDVAFLADGFPTDTFNNSYGETFLDRFTQAASGGVSDVMQMIGAKNLGEAVSAVQDIAGAGMISSGLEFVQQKAGEGEAALKRAVQKGGGSANIAGAMLRTASAVAAGARVDFPQVWKNSTFTPSYTMTIRLWNPSPGSEEITRKYIVGPLAAMILLGIPRAGSTQGSTYTWPFLCKVRAKGLFNLDAAYISSVSVIKGGDQQNIAWNQALGVVDVRIDFGSLYDSILVEDKFMTLQDSRPTLATYLEAVGGFGTEGRNKKDLMNPYNPNIQPLYEPIDQVLEDARKIFANERRVIIGSRNAQVKETTEPNAATLPRVNINLSEIGRGLVNRAVNSTVSKLFDKLN